MIAAGTSAGGFAWVLLAVGGLLTLGLLVVFVWVLTRQEPGDGGGADRRDDGGA